MKTNNVLLSPDLDIDNLIEKVDFFYKNQGNILQLLKNESILFSLLVSKRIDFLRNHVSYISENTIKNLIASFDLEAYALKKYDKTSYGVIINDEVAFTWHKHAGRRMPSIYFTKKPTNIAHRWKSKGYVKLSNNNIDAESLYKLSRMNQIRRDVLLLLEDMVINSNYPSFMFDSNWILTDCNRVPTTIWPTVRLSISSFYTSCLTIKKVKTCLQVIHTINKNTILNERFVLPKKSSSDDEFDDLIFNIAQRIYDTLVELYKKENL